MFFTYYVLYLNYILFFRTYSSVLLTCFGHYTVCNLAAGLASLYFFLANATETVISL